MDINSINDDQNLKNQNIFHSNSNYIVKSFKNKYYTNGQIPDKLRNLIEDCWKQNPKPTFTEIMNKMASNPENFDNSDIDSNVIKKYVDFVESTLYLNEQKISIQSEIQEFKKNFNFGEKFNIYLIDISHYKIFGKENCFTISYQNSINQPESDSTKKQNLCIIHDYNITPTSFNKQYLADQIEHYMNHNEIELSKFKGFSMTDEKSQFIPTIITERPVNGPLSTFLDQKIFLSEEQKFVIISGIVSGIQYIHENGFIHSNLNSKTVYLDENYHPKICDYVFIPPYKVETNYDEKKKKNTYKFTVHDNNNNDSNSLYMAPEMLSEKLSFDNSVDIYSLGKIIFEILNCSTIKSPWKELIEKCTSFDPSSRPSAKTILDQLLDEKNEFIPSQISLEAYVYISKLKRKDKVIDIKNEMIPNIYEIDYEMLTIIEAAELGHIESLEKVASCFLKGERNLFHDDEWSYICYKKAVELGSVKSMIEMAKMVENGVGTVQNYSRASKIYKLAYDKMDADNPERSKIESKYKETDEKSKILKIKVLSDQITSENIKLHLNLDVQYEICQENNAYELKFQTQKELIKSAKEIKNNKDFEILNKNTTKYLNLPLPIINLEDFESRRIDKGSYGTVYTIHDNTSNKQFTAKVIERIQDVKQIDRIKREIIINSKFNHPSIIKFIGYSRYNIIHSKESKCQDLTLLMDYVPNKTFSHILEYKTPIDSTIKLKIILGIAFAISLIHKHNLIHRDIKPDNILLNENYEPILCDFGCARQYIDESSKKTFGCSSSNIYMAPELFTGDLTYSYKVDVYSFGILLYQLLDETSYINSFKSDFCLSKLCLLKTSKNGLDISNDLNPILADLIKQCCDVSISSRPDSQTIVKILTRAIKNREKLLNDLNFDQVDEYLNRIILKN